MAPAAMVGEDHNFPLPGGQARGKAPQCVPGKVNRATTGIKGALQGLGLRPAQGGHVRTPAPPAEREGPGEGEAFRWGEGDHDHSSPDQGESVGAALGLGLRPAQRGRASAQRGGRGLLTPRRGGVADKPAGLGNEGWRAPVRAHGRASLEAT